MDNVSIFYFAVCGGYCFSCAWFAKDILETRSVQQEVEKRIVPPQVKMEFLASKIRHFLSPQPKL